MFADYHRPIRKRKYSGLGDFGKGLKLPSISAPKITIGSKPLAPIVKTVTNIATAPLKAVSSALPILKPITTLATNIVNEAGRAVQNPFVLVGGPTGAVLKPLVDIATAKPQTQMAQPSTEPVYQDANGNVITKAQYDAAMLQYNQPQPLTAPTIAPNIAPQQLTSSSQAQDYYRQGPVETSVSTEQQADTGEQQVSEPVYQDQYGRKTNKAGFPIDDNGSVIPLNQMPEYKNTVITAINSLQGGSR